MYNYDDKAYSIQMEGGIYVTEAALAAQREYKRKYREKNRDKINEYAKKWRKNNPDKVRQYAETYWTKKINEKSG